MQEQKMNKCDVHIYYVAGILNSNADRQVGKYVLYLLSVWKHFLHIHLSMMSAHADRQIQ